MRCCGAAAALGFIAAAAYAEPIQAWNSNIRRSTTLEWAYVTEGRAGVAYGAVLSTEALTADRVVGRKVGAKEVGGKKVRTVKSPHTTQI